MTLLVLMRNDSSTAFFSHWLTFQPRCPSGSATRSSPLSSRSSARLIAGRRADSTSVDGRSVRRSQAESMVSSRDNISFHTRVDRGGRRREALHERRAQCFACGGIQHAIVFVVKLKEILDALAERCDARLVHAQLA